MAGTYGTITPNMQKYIQQGLEYAAYNQLKLYPWLKTIGAYKKIPEGLTVYDYTKIEKMEPGAFTVGFASLPENSPRFTDASGKLCQLGAKLVLPKVVLDGYNNNSLTRVSLADIIGTQQASFLTAIDQFCAWGDEMKTPRTDDPFAGQGEFTGLFNGGTTLASGDGSDNNMSAVKDFVSTKNNFKKGLQDAGHDRPPYYIFSDIECKNESESGVHLIANTDIISEYEVVMRDKEIKDWIYGTNLQNKSLESYFLMTTPFYNASPTKERQRFSYYLVESYPLEVIPLNAGGLNENLAYEFALIWQGRMNIIDATAIQVSADQTY